MAKGLVPKLINAMVSVNAMDLAWRHPHPTDAEFPIKCVGRTQTIKNPS